MVNLKNNLYTKINNFNCFSLKNFTGLLVDKFVLETIIENKPDQTVAIRTKEVLLFTLVSFCFIYSFCFVFCKSLSKYFVGCIL